MAARNRKGLSENTRLRIKTTMIVDRLEKHILGEVEMSQSQVSAAMGLLRKTLPDLSAVEHSGEITHKSPSEMTDDEILARLAEIRTATTGGDGAQDSGQKEPDSVH